ncbi:hypothetical protein LCGC14_2784940, partial [marine sediment metagenome]
MPLAGGLTALGTFDQFKGFGPTKRKPKKKRPVYSFDPKALRAGRKPRITIKELSQRGADILRERLPDLKPEDKRSGVMKVLDVLDIPRNLIANVIARTTGTMPKKARRGTLTKKVYWSEILKGMGVPKGPAASVLGFVADVGLDPLTWVSLAGVHGVRAAAHIPRIVGAGGAMMKRAAKTGQVTAKLARGLGIKEGARITRKAMRMQRMKSVLARRATKGSKEALEFIKEFGQHGRPLIRFPFMKKGLLPLKVGA